MTNLDKKLGITGEDVNASVLANSPLVAIEIEELLTYPDMQIVPWKEKGYLTGIAYNEFMHEMGKTAEGVSSVFDDVKEDPNGIQNYLHHRSILQAVRQRMTTVQQGATCSVTWADVAEIDYLEYGSCSFALIHPGSEPLYGLFDWEGDSKLP